MATKAECRGGHTTYRLIFNHTEFFSRLFQSFRLKFISLPPIYLHDRSNT